MGRDFVTLLDDSEEKDGGEEWGGHRMVYTCDSCGGDIREFKARYYCRECDRDQKSYDLCEGCWEAHEPKEHALVRLETSVCRPTALVKENPGAAEAARNKMLLFRERTLLSRVDWLAPDMTYHQTYVAARSLATELVARGMAAPLDRAVVLSENSMAWCVVDFACVFAGLTSLPLSTALHEGPLLRCLDRLGATLAFVSPEQLGRLVSLGRLSAFRNVVVIDDRGQADLGDLVPEGHLGSVVWWRSLTTIEDPSRWSPVHHRKGTDAATVLFTSGTTGGTPKGSVVTDQLVARDINQGQTFNDIQAMMMPLAYSSGRLLFWGTVSSGGRQVLTTGNPATLLQEVRQISPSFFQAPPVVWQELYNRFSAELESRKVGTPEDRQGQLRSVLLVEHAKSLGTRVSTVCTGSAATPKDVLEWMKECFGKTCRIAEGYGTTEAGGIATDGVLHEGLVYRLQDCPGLGYTQNDKPYPRGVLWVKTRESTKGYLSATAEENSETFSPDGYVCTGDIVEIDPEARTVKIVDRKRAMFKLASGSFVSPESLEGCFCGSPLVSQTFVYGESSWTSLAAVVVPNRPVAEARLASSPLPLESLLLDEMAGLVRQHGLKGSEVPQSILVDWEPWTVDNGLLTHSLKINRTSLTAKYRDRLRALHDGPAPQSTPSVSPHPAQQPSSDLAPRVLGIVESCAGLPKGSVSPADTVKSLGLDSVALASLSSRLQAEFGLGFPLKSLFDEAASPASIAQAASARHLLGNPALTKCVDWDVETELDPAIDKLFKTEPYRENYSKVQGGTFDVLLTGATGFIGVHLLQALLEQRHIGTIFCLCRCKEGVTATERLLQMISKYHVPVALGDNKVVALAGDLARPRLGLGDDSWATLSSKVCLIVHNGAEVNALLPYEALRGPNVNGTMEVIRLAMTFRLKRVVYVSSLSALAPDEGETTQLDAAGCGRLGGYGASKRAGEVLLRRAVERFKMEGSILRLGTIGWNVSTGAANTRDLYARVILSMMELGCYCADSSLSLLDVETVSRAIVEIGVFSLSAPGTFALHLSSLCVGRPNLSLADVAKVASSVTGKAVQALPHDQWAAAVCSRAGPLSPFRGILDHATMCGPDRDEEETSYGSPPHFVRALGLKAFEGNAVLDVRSQVERLISFIQTELKE